MVITLPPTQLLYPTENGLNTFFELENFQQNEPHFVGGFFFDIYQSTKEYFLAFQSIFKTYLLYLTIFGELWQKNEKTNSKNQDHEILLYETSRKSRKKHTLFRHIWYKYSNIFGTVISEQTKIIIFFNLVYFCLPNITMRMLYKIIIEFHRALKSIFLLFRPFQKNFTVK